MLTEAKWMMAASAEITIVVNASTSICCSSQYTYSTHYTTVNSTASITATETLMLAATRTVTA